MYMNILINK